MGLEAWLLLSCVISCVAGKQSVAAVLEVKVFWVLGEVLLQTQGVQEVGEQGGQEEEEQELHALVQVEQA